MKQGGILNDGKLYHLFNSLAIRVGGKKGLLSAIFIKAGYSKPIAEEISIGSTYGEKLNEVGCNYIYHEYIQTQRRLPAPENLFTLKSGCRSVNQEAFHHEFLVTLHKGKFFSRGFIVIDADGKFVREISHFPNLALQNHPAFKDAILPKVKHLKGTAILIRAGVHYHTLQEGLLSLFLFRALGFNVSDVNHFIIFNVGNASLENIADVLEIPASKIITCGYYTGIGFSAETLLAPSYFNRLGNWYQTFLQEYIKRNKTNITTAKMFFVTRGKSVKRKLTNEAELLPILESVGFTIIDNEVIPFSEQITWFHQAELVIGVHGSNLANILFCTPTTHVIEIRHSSMNSYLADCYYKMAVSNQIRYSVFFDDSPTAEKDPDIYVNPIEFSRFLKKVLDS